MVYMYHSFLIHSSADGHLGCFHVLAMINSAAMNTGVYVSLSILASYLPRSKHHLISWLQSSTAVILEPPKIKSLTVSIVSPSVCHEGMGLDAKILVS